VRTVCEPIFAKPIKDISFGRLLMQLFQTARQFNMEVQPQLVLLQKTLFNIEGLGRRLYPELDLWETAKPYLEEWARERMGPRALLRTLRTELPKWWSMFPRMPGLLHETFRRAAEGELALEWRSAEVRQMREQLRQNQRRMYWTIVGSAAVIAAALMLTLDGASMSTATFGGWLLGGAGIFLLWRARPTGA